MAEKVIHEVRFIETDDGFRIEVKGDKERWQKMGFGPGMMCLPGMGLRHGMRFWRRARKAWMHKHGAFAPPWMWGWWDEESEQDEEEEPSENV